MFLHTSSSELFRPPSLEIFFFYFLFDTIFSVFFINRIPKVFLLIHSDSPSFVVRSLKISGPNVLVAIFTIISSEGTFSKPPECVIRDNKNGTRSSAVNRKIQSTALSESPWKTDVVKSHECTTTHATQRKHQPFRELLTQASSCFHRWIVHCSEMFSL